METVIAWLFATMLAFSPASTGEHYKNPAARESASERAERYRGIAEAVARVAFDPDERPLFPGPRGRHATAALMLGIAWEESAWRRDVDLGEGKAARGGGTDTCLMQVRLARHRLRDGSVVEDVTREGWGWRDLVTDREKCFRAALHIIRRSFGACRDLGPDEALAAYARGNCTDSIGHAKSRKRIQRGRQLLGLKPLPPAEAPPPPPPPAPPAPVVAAPVEGAEVRRD